MVSPKPWVNLQRRLLQVTLEQDYTVTYIGSSLDENLSGKSVELNVINKINSTLRFPYI